MTVLLNGEVLLFGSVAVAAMNWPEDTPALSFTEKVAVPEPIVATVIEPKKVCPSPNPEGFLTAFAKKTVPRKLTACERRRFFLPVEGGVDDCPN